jgi:hypothetical protein
MVERNERTFPERLLAVENALSEHRIPHAFGGAIALAAYAEPRATQDLDINVFVPPASYPLVLDALRTLIPDLDIEAAGTMIQRDGQIRVRWGELPIDLFFSNLDFHDSCAQRVQSFVFENHTIPILSAEDLILFKAGFGRGKDWLDIRNMFGFLRGRLDIDYIRRWADVLYLPENSRTLRLNRYFESLEA